MHSENIEYMAIENPFIFGKAAEGTYFTDRTEDAKRLHANLTHGINTIIISPRRWGKTSLVKKVIADINRPDIKPVFIDILTSGWRRQKTFSPTSLPSSHLAPTQ